MGEKNIVVQPAGRTEDPGARLWQIWLAVLLLGGTLLSFWDSWVDLGIAPVLPTCLGTAALALTLAAAGSGSGTGGFPCCNSCRRWCCWEC